MIKSGSYARVFEEAIKKSFASVIVDYGFSLNKIYDSVFELESSDCSVMIILERRQVFIEIKPVRLDQVPDGEFLKKLDLGRIIRCIDPLAGYRPRSNLDLDGIQEEVNRLSILLQRYCTSFLAGDFSEWERICDERC